MRAPEAPNSSSARRTSAWASHSAASWIPSRKASLAWRRRPMRLRLAPRSTCTRAAPRRLGGGEHLGRLTKPLESCFSLLRQVPAPANTPQAPWSAERPRPAQVLGGQLERLGAPSQRPDGLGSSGAPGDDRGVLEPGGRAQGADPHEVVQRRLDVAALELQPPACFEVEQHEHALRPRLLTLGQLQRCGRLVDLSGARAVPAKDRRASRGAPSASRERSRQRRARHRRPRP